jgi:hypothetical protein
MWILILTLVVPDGTAMRDVHGFKDYASCSRAAEMWTEGIKLMKKEYGGIKGGMAVCAPERAP